ncbi:cytochrome c [Phenylobacterium sp.]|uniref:c-type cytochrome n=1 Tax=Phenylobacterium sp. TaxID=1871053 RepID=UPI0025D004A9|nr:cytochrome c [Phenylobacterium sp.]
MRRQSLLTGVLLAAFAAVAVPAGAQSARALYLLKCSGCHRADGQGAAEAGVPPFPGFIGDLARDPGGRTYMLHVPGVASSGLSDADLTIVLNYLLDRWSAAPVDRIQRFTPGEVATLRAVDVSDIVKYRRTLVARLRKTGAAIAEYPWP